MDITEFMILHKKEYNEVRASRERRSLTLTGWFQAKGVGQSRDDPGTQGFTK